MKQRVTLALVLLASAAGAAENLVHNGSFEAEGGWVTPSSHYPERVTIDTNTAAHGRASLKLDGRGGQLFLDSCVTRKVDIRPGKTYAVRVAIRRTSAKGNICLAVTYVDAGDITHTMASFGNSPLRGTDSWEYFFGTFTFPATYKKPWLRLYSTDSGGITWFDDIDIREIAPGEDPYALACRRANVAPTIDGRLSEWQSSDTAADFILVNGEAVHAIGLPFKTEVRLLYDDQNLYIGAALDEPAGYQRKTESEGHDQQVWADDALEVFLSPGPDSKTYFHVCVNSAGAVYDAYKDADAVSPGDPAWNCGAIVKAASGKNGWQFEMAIPWTSLKGFRMKSGQAFAANFCRQMRSGAMQASKNSSWSRIEGRSDFHRPEVFQKVMFSDTTTEPPKTVSNYRYLRGAGLLSNPDFSLLGTDGAPAFWQYREGQLFQVLETGFRAAGARFDLTLLAPGMVVEGAALQYKTPAGDVRSVKMAVDPTRGGHLVAARLVLPENASSVEGFSLRLAAGKYPVHVQVTGSNRRHFRYRQKLLYQQLAKRNRDVLPKETGATFALYPDAGLVRGVPSVFPFNSISSFEAEQDRNFRMTLDLPKGIDIYSLGLCSRSRIVGPGAEGPQRSPLGTDYQRSVIRFSELTHHGQLDLELVTDLPPGKKKPGRYQLEWAGGKQEAETFGIHVYEKLRIKAPRRFVAGVYMRLDFKENENRGSILDDPETPAFLEALHGFGLNTILIGNAWAHQRAPRPLAERFVARIRDAGMDPVLHVSGRYGATFYARARKEGAESVVIDGTKNPALCPSYRGPAYREMVETWGDVARHGIYWVDNDFEDWNYRAHTICFCPRCKEAFKKWLPANRKELEHRDPLEFERAPGKFPKLHKAWYDFKNELILEWHTDVVDELRKHMEAAGIRQTGFPRIGITGCEGWDWARMTESGVLYFSPMIYAYLDGYAEPVVASLGTKSVSWRKRINVDRRNFVVTIAPGERDGRVLVPPKAIMYQVLEVAGSGAAGFKIWYHRVMNGGQFYWIARALRMIQPVEDILLDGEMVEVPSENPSARIRFFKHDRGTLLFVAEYAMGETELKVPVEVSRQSKVFDLNTRRELATLPPGENMLPITLDDDRVRLLFIGTPDQWHRCF